PGQRARPAPAEVGEGGRRARVAGANGETLGPGPVGAAQRVGPRAIVGGLEAVDDHVHVPALEQGEQLGERTLNVARGSAEPLGEETRQLGLEPAQVARRLLEDVGGASLGVRPPAELWWSRGEGDP